MCNAENSCPVCNSRDCTCKPSDSEIHFSKYDCSNCGVYYISTSYSKEPQTLSKAYDTVHLKRYLYHHKNDSYAPFICPEEEYDPKECSKIQHAYHLTPQKVEAWYPSNTTERIDKILLFLSNQTQYVGEHIHIKSDLTPTVFCMVNEYYKGIDEPEIHQWEEEIEYLLNYLERNDYIKCVLHGRQSIHDEITTFTFSNTNPIIEVCLTPKAIDKKYELQQKSMNKNVFVAMKYGEETTELRAKIKEGLAGYNVRIMDEIEHNGQIIPKMLHEIQNSKFVVAELTYNNSGVYYEAGYALGAGKEVIHLCKRSAISDGVHFDVAQRNAILYDEISEIPEKLKNRIKVTIELSHQ